MRIPHYLLLAALFFLSSPVNGQSPGPGYCLGFNTSASGQYVSIPQNSSLNADSAITIEAWIMPMAFASNSWGNVIVGKDGWGSGPQGYTLRCGGSGDLSFNFGASGNWRETIANGVLQTSTWQHVAATFDGDSLIVYVNGIRKNATAFSGTIASSNYDLNIGRIPYTSSGTREFSGELDEIRIWRKALPVATIRDWMCKKISASHPNFVDLMGNWRFDEGTGTTLADLSANGNNGTVSAGMVWGYSGAAIGDESVYDYGGTPSLILAGTAGDSLVASNYAGNLAGLQLYRVDTSPNYTNLPANYSELDSSHYWGVFGVDVISGLNLDYHYGSYPYASNAVECELARAGRLQATSSNWNNSGASRNLNTNELSLTMSGKQEFILGLNPNPHPVIAGGHLQFCLGDSVLLQTTNSPNLAYAWHSNGNPIAAATTANYTASAAAQYHVQVTEGNCIYNSDSVEVNVWALPSVSFTGPANLCINESPVVLSSGQPLGGIFAGPGVSGSTFDPLQAGIGQHTLSYSYSDSNGCTNSDTAGVSVFSAPSAFFSNPPDQCDNGAPILLNTATPAGGNYSGPGIGNNFFDPSQTGTGTFTLYYTITNSNSCSAIDSAQITVHPAPLSPTISVSGDTLFSSSSTGSQWYDLNGPISGATGIFYIPSISGSYYVIVTDSNACVSDSSQAILFVGIEHAQQLQFDLFPNPNQGSFQVSIYLTGVQTLSIRISDLQGRIVMIHSFQNLPVGLWTHKLDLETLPKGMYLLQIQTETGLAGKKLIIE